MIRPCRITRRRFVVGGAVVAALGACRSGATKTGRAGSTSGSAAGGAEGTDSRGLAASSAAASDAGAHPVTLPPTSAPEASLRPAVYVPHASRSVPRVALTFHASGDPILAQRLLDVVVAAGVPITVFGVGRWMAAHPDIVARIARDGHELANHTLTHQSMGQLSATAVAQEVAGCAAVLRQLTGSITAWFRPSGIEVPTPAILLEAGRAGYPVSVGYDVDSLDFQDPGAVAIEANVRDRLQAGSIVSLHFGHRGTIDAFGPIVEHARASGLQPVTVSQLLG